MSVEEMWLRSQSANVRVQPQKFQESPCASFLDSYDEGMWKSPGRCPVLRWAIRFQPRQASGVLHRPIGRRCYLRKCSISLVVPSCQKQFVHTVQVWIFYQVRITATVKKVEEIDAHYSEREHDCEFLYKSPNVLFVVMKSCHSFDCSPELAIIFRKNIAGYNVANDRQILRGVRAAEVLPTPQKSPVSGFPSLSASLRVSEVRQALGSLIPWSENPFPSARYTPTHSLSHILQIPGF